MLRRDLLTKTFLSTVSLAAIPKIAWAQALVCKPGVTPRQTSGPFYPTTDFQENSIDSNADLVSVDGIVGQATGDIVIVEGRVMDQHCNSASGALVEIWQACASGRYNHEDDPNKAAPIDPHFQYWGKALTDANGFYRFRTIIPGSYPASVGWDRPPHIHFKITGQGYTELITQMYFKNDPLNDFDQILQSLKKSDQDKLVVEFKTQATQPHPVGQFNIQIRKIT